jgi:hypothetical protein
MMAIKSDELIDLNGAARGLLALLPSRLLHQSQAILVCAEITNGVGSTDIYVVGQDAGVRHLLSERHLLRQLFEFFYALPSAVDSSSTSWSTAVFRWSFNGAGTLALSSDEVSDSSRTAERRAAWERSEFGSKPIARVDDF